MKNMLLLDIMIGRLEVVIEKHDTALGFQIETGKGELNVDLGRFSLLTTLAQPPARKRRFSYAAFITTMSLWAAVVTMAAPSVLDAKDTMTFRWAGYAAPK